MISDALEKTGNVRQIGGIETAVLDNGPGRGVRVASVNTGTPLWYQVVIDRALDIGEAFYAGKSLAWLSHGGITTPQPGACKGLQWLDFFGGGLLTTCGLTHIGAPEKDESGAERGLHGRISNLPAELVNVEQPDLRSGNPRMSITALVRQTSVFGPCLELHRTISSYLGRSEIKISDKVINCSNTPVPHMLLYHCNFGYPLVNEGAAINWDGKFVTRGTPADDAIFASDHDYTTCSAPLDDHCGGGEACAFITPEQDENGFCHAGISNPQSDLSVVVEFKQEQLPCLTNWQHWGRFEYVTALEPGTNHPIGQNAARSQKKLIMLEPGEERNYDLTLSAGALK
ncbi:MAG: aldose 1-epimerase family protein [Lentisphaeria bacterium]